MFGYPLVCLAVAADSLGPVIFHGDRYVLRPAVRHIITVKDGLRLAVGKSVPVRRREETLGHGQIIDGIQEIGLSLPVVTAYTVNFGRECDIGPGNILEIADDYSAQIHRGVFIMSKDRRNLVILSLRLDNLLYFCIHYENYKF